MKTETLSVRVPADLVSRVAKFSEKTGVERASLVRASLEAVLSYYEKHDFMAFPIEIVPKVHKMQIPAEKPKVQMGPRG
jgi:predicted DNA-binding protein